MFKIISPGKVIMVLTVFLAGCAATPCELAVDNLLPPQKIDKVVHISIADKIKADEGGQKMLKSYVTMSNQITSVKENCKKPK